MKKSGITAALWRLSAAWLKLLKTTVPHTQTPLRIPHESGQQRLEITAFAFTKHCASRRDGSVEAGVADRVWTLEEVIGLIPLNPPVCFVAVEK